MLALVMVSCGEKEAEKPGLGEKAGAAAAPAGKAASDLAGKFKEIEAALSEQADLMESSAAQLEKAPSAKDAADVLTALAGKQEKLMATMKALSEKFPEMKTMAEPPAELKAVMEKMARAGAKFGQTMSTVMQKYGSDPLVQEAMKKFQAVSSKMQE
jgi:hypothetical protein